MADNVEVTTETPPQDDSSNNLAELQETVSRISAHKGIESVVIWNESTRDIVYGQQNDAKKAAVAQRLLKAAEEYFGHEEVSFVQIKSKSGKELMISPDQGFVLAVEKQ